MKRLIKGLLKLFNINVCKVPSWEKNKFVWLKDQNIRTIFDIGAHVGEYALELNQYLPQAMIYAFEPLSSAYPILLKNTAPIQRFKAFNIALGDYKGAGKIHRHEFSPASSILKVSDTSIEAYPYIGNSVVEEIAIDKLDDFILANNLCIEPEILIKMDVQGFEDKVIAGGLEIIKKSKIIIIEVEFQEMYDEQALFDDTYIRLRELGLRFKGIINTVLHPDSGIPLYADAVFTRK